MLAPYPQPYGCRSHLVGFALKRIACMHGLDLEVLPGGGDGGLGAPGRGLGRPPGGDVGRGDCAEHESSAECGVRREDNGAKRSR